MGHDEADPSIPGEKPDDINGSALDAIPRNNEANSSISDEKLEDDNGSGLDSKPANDDAGHKTLNEKPVTGSIVTPLRVQEAEVISSSDTSHLSKDMVSDGMLTNTGDDDSNTVEQSIEDHIPRPNTSDEATSPTQQAEEP